MMTQRRGAKEVTHAVTTTRPINSMKNRVAASLADARFRPKRTQDKTKEHPRQRKHKDQDDDE